MTRTPALLLWALAMVALPASAAPIPKDGEYIKLKDHINVKMSENLHSEEIPDNNLKELKAGKQKLGDVTYDIGAGVLQLGSSMVKGKPEKIEGIAFGPQRKDGSRLLLITSDNDFKPDEATHIYAFAVRLD